ncbi:MAG TPA: MFS transporter [Candidatus Limnocylindrales bacterium]|nr:MFS transporter [Candidatus Limnocylindrales bacterium]
MTSAPASPVRPPGHDAAQASRPLPLRGNRDFRALLGSQAISALGDAVSFTALPLLVLALTGSGLAMGIVGALQTLPDLVFGMVAGALADRSDRRRMMFLADFGRAILTALIPISVLLGGPTLAVVLVVAAPMSMLRALFLAGYTASVPAIVGRSQVGSANAVFEAVYSFGYILGPAVAGLLASAIGPGLTLAVDAVSFLVSALGILLIGRSLRAPGDRPTTSIRADIREGIAYLAGHRVLRAAVAFWGLTSVTLAPLVAALTYHVTRELGLDEAALGLVLTAFGVGTVTGALLAARLRRRVVGLTLLLGNLGTGAAVMASGLLPDLAPLLVAAFVGGVSQTTILVTYITLRTVASPDALLGRIGSTARTISLGLQPVGLVVGGLLIDTVGAGTALVLIGGVVIVIGLAFAPVADLRRASLTGR